MRRIELTPSLANKILAELAEVPLFEDVSPVERERVLRHAELVEAPVGEPIVRQGEPSDAIYLLLSGELAVTVTPTEGETFEVESIGPGTPIGELGVLLGEPRSATVTALRTSRLLRMDGSTLRELFALSPGFALSAMRQLARTVKTSLVARDRQTAEETPDNVVLERPDVTRERAYLTQYYSSAIQSIARRHRLILSRRFPTYEAPFRMTEDERQRWWALFGTSAEAGPRVPFLYCSTSGTMLLMKAVSSVGVNLRHLLHLTGEMFFDTDRILVPDEDYRMVLRLEDIVPMGADRIALVIAYRVHDAEDRIRYSTKEYFIIRHLDPEYLAMLKRASGLGRHDTSRLVGVTKREPKLGPEHSVATLPVPPDMAVQYGRISGDPSIWHTTPMTAKLFGFKKPFIQGLCTTNYLMSTLTMAGLGPVRSLTVTYARHVYVDSTLDVRVKDGAFEICDEDGKLLAFGEWERP